MPDGTVESTGKGDSRVPIYRTVHDRDSDRSFGLSVIEALATAMDVDPLEMEPPLYEVIDHVALDMLFSPTKNGDDHEEIVVRFDYDGYEVTVSNDGTINIFER